VVTPVHRVSGLSNPEFNNWPTSWGEGHDHASLNDTGLHTSDGNRANTTDLVHVLERETERLVGRTSWRVDSVDCLKQSLAAGLCLGFLLPTLVPGAVGGVIDHVITIETGDRHEGNGLGVVSNLLDEVGGFLDDLVEAILGPLGGVHLVDSDDQLLDTQGIGEQSVLAGLAIFGDTGFEFTGTGSNNEDSAVGLRGTSDHVLDKVTMTGRICQTELDVPFIPDVWRLTDNGDIVFGSFEFPKSDIDGNTTLTLSLQLVEHPCVLEGALAQL